MVFFFSYFFYILLNYTMENLSKLLDSLGQSTLLLIILLNPEMLIRLEVEILMLGGYLAYSYGMYSMHMLMPKCQHSQLRS